MFFGLPDDLGMALANNIFSSRKMKEYQEFDEQNRQDEMFQESLDATFPKYNDED